MPQSVVRDEDGDGLDPAELLEESKQWFYVRVRILPDAKGVVAAGFGDRVSRGVRVEQRDALPGHVHGEWLRDRAAVRSQDEGAAGSDELLGHGQRGVCVGRVVLEVDEQGPPVDSTRGVDVVDRQCVASTFHGSKGGERPRERGDGPEANWFPRGGSGAGDSPRSPQQQQGKRQGQERLHHLLHLLGMSDKFYYRA